MKPSMLGLLIAAGAFGASTIYLAAQLNDERAHADEVLEQSRVLSARIAELEAARAELESMRMMVGAAGADGAAAPAVGGRPAALPTSASVELSESPAVEGSPERARTGGPPVRTEAMQKMMRSQLRANFKRMNADIGDKLGLTREETNKLIDLMIDQQMDSANRGRGDRGANFANDKNMSEVAALIGPGKIDAYKAYQDTMPARQEVDMLSRQLEANDMVLSKDQRDRLVTALAEERRRVPQPKFSESVSREEYSKAMTAWQDDYNQRTATRASSILDSEQQTSYSEYQQWHKEMRLQFEARRSARQ
jgi:hypothetical protein